MFANGLVAKIKRNIATCPISILTFIQNREEMSPHRVSNVDINSTPTKNVSPTKNVMLDVCYVSRKYQVVHRMSTILFHVAFFICVTHASLTSALLPSISHKPSSGMYARRTAAIHCRRQPQQNTAAGMPYVRDR